MPPTTRSRPNRARNCWRWPRQGSSSVDTDVRAPIYKKMAAQLAEEAFLIFVTNSPILIGVSEKTANNPTVVYRYGEDSINLRGLKANE